jgi:hypothetical protein
MRITSTEGVVERMVRGSRARSTIGAYQNAVRTYLATGDTTAIEPFVDKRVAGVTLEADPDTLEEQFMRGELEFLEIYSGSETHDAT